MSSTLEHIRGGCLLNATSFPKEIALNSRRISFINNKSNNNNKINSNNNNNNNKYNKRNIIYNNNKYI